MSSLRNAIPRRPHKERAQEHGRSKHGLLEKHKDYSLRARDHNEKKARLKILRQKAAERNPDEFHFAMMSSKTKNGVKIADRGNKALSMDVVKLLKTQDAGYLRTMLQRSRVERQKLEQEMVLVNKEGDEGTRLTALQDEEGRSANKHTVFVNDEADQEAFDPAEWFDTDAAGVNNAYNRRRRIIAEGNAEDQDIPIAVARPKGPRELEKDRLALREQRALLKKRQREQDARKAKLAALREREKDLTVAEQELEAQRARMTNSAGGVNKNGVKFKTRERKR